MSTISIQQEIQFDFDRRQRAKKTLKYVQVRVQGITTCASVSERWTTRDGVPMTKLDLISPWKGTAHAPDSRIRDCSGVDGRCTCVPVDQRADREPAEGGQACAARPGAQGAVCTLPNGNHGDNDFSDVNPSYDI